MAALFQLISNGYPDATRGRWWSVRQVAEPDTEPLSLAEVKAHLRVVDDDSEDSTITNMIATARSYVESFTGRALISRQFNAMYCRFPGDRIQIPVMPLVSVDGVFYTDSSETEQAVSSSLYVANARVEPAEVVLKLGNTWPSATLSPSWPVRILFTAGYGTTGDTVPYPIRQAMLLHVGHMFANREAVGGKTELAPMAFRSLLDAYRVPLSI